MSNKTLRSILGAAGLAALFAGTAMAHHGKNAESEFLAFWSGYRSATDPAPTPQTCRDGRFWERGFVSIYSQGAE